MRAVPRADAHHSLCGERLDGFPHHTAPDAEAGFEIRLGRQGRSDRNVILRNFAAEPRQHVANAPRLDAPVGGPWLGHLVLLLISGEFAIA